MANQSYKPGTNSGIGLMLVTFDTAINANSGALATKYGVTAAELARVHQSRLVWEWFEDVLAVARAWTTSLTQSRSLLSAPPNGETDPLPGLPALEAVPVLQPGPPPVYAMIDHGFFTFFGQLVTGIKNTGHYDVADGKLLGIEGTPLQPPSPSIVPALDGEIFSGGEPELTCPKGQFQGFDVYVTLPGKPRAFIGTSMSRRYLVNLPLPAAGTAEVWIFQVQYRYQNAPFGQFSQPLALTVRG